MNHAITVGEVVKFVLAIGAAIAVLAAAAWVLKVLASEWDH